MGATKFPGPYVNEAKVDRSMMEYVTFENTDIGARTTGLPKDIKNNASLEHVGGTTPGPVPNKFP